MLHALGKLGIETCESEGSFVVRGDIRDITDGDYDLDVDLSGLSLRFLLALSCVSPGVQTLFGKPGLNKRPVGELVEALRALGADIEYLEKPGFPPVRVRSRSLDSGEVSVPGGISSQYFSALLMIAPRVSGDVCVKVSGKQISRPYVDMTIGIMREFGVEVENKNFQSYIVTGPQQYLATTYAVEGDYSSAAYFFATAALTYSTITVRNLNPRSAQADRRLLELLEVMGSEITTSETSVTVTGNGVKSGSFDMSDCPDQAMTMAVLAAFGQGETVITGVQSLRIKETERVEAVEKELAKMGIRTKSTPDTLTVMGGRPTPAVIDTYGDHRIAMAFAVAGMRIPGIVINNPEVASKTFPEFWDRLKDLDASNIVLIGMRGTGKSTIGRLLAKRLGKAIIDMDSNIVAKVGMSISELVAKRGWEYFRDEESEVAKLVGASRNSVIAAGGGAVLRPQNAAALGTRGVFVLLTAPISVLAERIQGDTDRSPLSKQVSVQAELSELWGQRKELYESIADRVVQTQNRTPEEVVTEICARVGGGR
jgi:3-phosphoshikimate 1-carboxyvinyltransferase